MKKQTLRLNFKKKRSAFSEDKVQDLSIDIVNQVLKLNIWNYNNFHVFFPIEKNNEIDIEEGKEKKIERWFGTLNLSLEDDVYLSWDPETALKTKLKYVVKYWKSLYYRDSDDLTVFSENLNWSLLFFHEGKIYFGSK